MDRIKTTVLLIIAISGSILLLYGIFGKTYVPSPQPQFVVVDKYEGCDVVRYTNHSDALYHYFLHCNHT